MKSIMNMKFDKVVVKRFTNAFFEEVAETYYYNCTPAQACAWFSSRKHMDDFGKAVAVIAYKGNNSFKF